MECLDSNALLHISNSASFSYAELFTSLLFISDLAFYKNREFQDDIYVMLNQCDKSTKKNLQHHFMNYILSITLMLCRKHITLFYNMDRIGSYSHIGKVITVIEDTKWS